MSARRGRRSRDATCASTRATTSAVEIDPRLASSALAHLLENAARYAPDGPIDVRGWTDGGRPAGSRSAIAGPGSSRPSSSGSSSRSIAANSSGMRIPGTGMGLAITRGLVAADGGRVWAENVAPHGACFTIADPGADAAGRGRGADVMAARILIVDDEPSILATMAPLLRGRGYEVATATSGHAALDAVDARRAAARHPRSRACRISTASRCAGGFARGGPCRSSCCRRAAPRRTRSRRSTPARTTT